MKEVTFKEAFKTDPVLENDTRKLDPDYQMLMKETSISKNILKSARSHTITDAKTMREIYETGFSSKGKMGFYFKDASSQVRDETIDIDFGYNAQSKTDHALSLAGLTCSVVAALSLLSF